MEQSSSETDSPPPGALQTLAPKPRGDKKRAGNCSLVMALLTVPCLRPRIILCGESDLSCFHFD
jgi:hypothetical protein